VAVIRDPSATDDVVLAIDELHLTEVWEGEAILIKRHHSATDEQQPFGMAWLVGQVLRERKLFKDIGLAAFVSTVFAIAPPFIFMIVLDRVLVNNSYSTLDVLVGAILIMLVFETVLTYLRGILTQVATTRIDGRLNLYIVEKLLKLPMDYFERTPTGRTLGKLGQIQQIRHFLTGAALRRISGCRAAHWTRPGDAVSRMALGTHGVRAGGHHFRDRHAVLEADRSAASPGGYCGAAKGSHLVETIYGIRTVKSLALEGRRRREWDRRVADAAAAHHAFGLMANYPHTLSLPFQRLIYSGCMAVGAYMVLVTPGTINRRRRSLPVSWWPLRCYPCGLPSR